MSMFQIVMLQPYLSKYFLLILDIFLSTYEGYREKQNLYGTNQGNALVLFVFSDIALM